METQDSRPDAAGALASLAGRSDVAAVGQNGTELPLEVLEVGADTVRGLVPRLRLVGVEQLTLRFAHEMTPWAAVFELETAEYHSDEQALVALRLLSLDTAGSGRVAPRVTIHAAGMLRAGHCQNAVRGNEYTVRVDDVSETGMQFSTELQLVRGDQFSVTFEALGRRLHLDAEAMSSRPGPYGRQVVGARILGFGPGDVKTIRELVGEAG